MQDSKVTEGQLLLCRRRASPKSPFAAVAHGAFLVLPRPKEKIKKGASSAALYQIWPPSNARFNDSLPLSHSQRH